MPLPQLGEVAIEFLDVPHEVGDSFPRGCLRARSRRAHAASGRRREAPSHLARFGEANPVDQVERPRRISRLYAGDPKTGLRPLTLTPLILGYIEQEVTRGNFAPTTAHGARASLGSFAAFFGERPMGDLAEVGIIDAWFAATEHLAPYTRFVWFGDLRVFFRRMFDQGLVPVDPTAGIRVRRPPKAQPRSLNRSAIPATLKACRTDTERAVIWLMAGCGLRSIEIARAQWTDYDEHAETILVRGKGGHQRLLPVPKQVGGALAAVRSGHRTGSIIRGYHYGRPISAGYISGIAHDVLLRAGVKQGAWDGVSGHSLRHTAANDVLERSRDIQAVQQMLGHADIVTTLTYVRRIDLTTLRTAMEGRDYSALDDVDGVLAEFSSNVPRSPSA